jgi:hypothetical protein
VNDPASNEPGTPSAIQRSRYLGEASRRYPNGRPLCGADKGFDESGAPKGTCNRTAGQQTPHVGSGACKWHGGTAPNHIARGERVAAEEAAAKVRSESGHILRTYSDFTDEEIAGIIPANEVLRLIAWAQHKLNLYGRLIRDAYEAAERLKAAAAAERITLIAAQTELDERGREQPEHPELQTARADMQRVFALGGVTALVGVKYDADRNGNVYGVDEGCRALVGEEGKAADRLRQNLALAHTMRIDEKRIDIAKTVGAAIHSVLVRALARFGVTVSETESWQILVEEMDAQERVGAAA